MEIIRMMLAMMLVMMLFGGLLPILVFLFPILGGVSLLSGDGELWFMLPIGLVTIALVVSDVVNGNKILDYVTNIIERIAGNYTQETKEASSIKDLTPQTSPALADKETLNKWLEHNSVSAKSLIETKSDIERENFFAHHLQDSETAKSVHRQFNKQYVWPARKKALQDELDKSDLTTTDRQMFADRLDSLDEEMPEQSFTSFSQELKKFQEQHIRKQNHIKYEGRLSNKDIQSIKEYHGCICMGCGLNPATEYGEQMRYMLEAHHKKPWGQMEENSTRTVSPEDFLILCPNCHKIIHKLESADDLDALQRIVRNK